MTKKTKITLDRNARIARTLGSQGKCSLLAQGLEAQELDALEGCCSDDGNVSEKALMVVSEVVAAYYDRQKATVDDTPAAPKDTPKKGK